MLGGGSVDSGHLCVVGFLLVLMSKASVSVLMVMPWVSHKFGR